MNFQEAVAYITSLEKRGWRLGLDRMEEFIRLAGLDGAIGPIQNSKSQIQESPQFIHIAGTNGKGSVTAYIQSLLVEHRVNTGAFFSPFVFDVRERIQLGRELISKEDFALAATALSQVADQMVNTPFDGPTEFEFKTAMGFWIWKQKQCEWVALEVGLGGRLDATNVVHPASTAIVSIGLDHTAILGETLDQIAAEKAGIIKPGVPVIIGDLPESASRTVKGIAASNSAQVLSIGHEITIKETGYSFTVHTPNGNFEDLVCGIKGTWQPHNAAIAIAALSAANFKLDEEQTKDGIARAFVPGRMQQLTFKGRKFLLDGAHNTDSAKALSEWLRANITEQVTVIAGMLQGHDSSEFFKHMNQVTKTLHLAPISNSRARDPKEIAKELHGTFSAIHAHASVQSALEIALAETQPDDLIVVTGSFYLVGEFGNLILNES